MPLDLLPVKAALFIRRPREGAPGEAWEEILWKWTCSSAARPGRHGRRFCGNGHAPLHELWNEGEVSIPSLHKLELFTGLNAFSIQQFTVVNFRS